MWMFTRNITITMHLANEDVAWIETQVLVAGTLNSFIAYVDYIPPSKKSAATRKELKSIYRHNENIVAPRIKANSGKK